MYALSIATWTLGEIAFSSVAPAVIADLAPRSLRGTYQGTYQMTWGAASCLGPLIGSAVLARAGSTTLWSGCLVVGVVAALGHLLIAGPRQRRLASLEGRGSARE